MNADDRSMLLRLASENDMVLRCTFSDGTTADYAPVPDDVLPDRWTYLFRPAGLEADLSRSDMCGPTAVENALARADPDVELVTFGASMFSEEPET